MPYVNVRLTPQMTTRQSRQIVEEITATLVRVLGKNPEHTHIVIDEVDSEGWGFSGQLTSDFRENIRCGYLGEWGIVMDENRQTFQACHRARRERDTPNR